ncbi:MAG: hypothetical protein EOO38_19180 [Cytophagaceae bacterium]|nr:MAG: hypothetical protein EOO38_19180 [Cytophagaceae bacterium]
MASNDSRPKSTNNTGRSNRPQYKAVVNRSSNRQLFGNPPTNGAEKRQIVGQYMLGKTIGEGTFGKVKLGVHIPTGEKVS